MTRRALLGGLAAAGVALAADWKTAPFPAWSDDAVRKLLVDSPWAHSRAVKILWYGAREGASRITYKDIPGTQAKTQASPPAGAGPLGGIGSGTKMRNRLPDSADLILRWASALPVRQAEALFRARRQQAAAKATEMVGARPGPGYSFEVFGIPTVAAHAGTEAVSALFTRSAAIRTKAGRIIRAERTVTEVAGEVLSSTIYFPGEEPITATDREIEVSGSIGILEFSEKYRIHEMKYLNSIEI